MTDERSAEEVLASELDWLHESGTAQLSTTDLSVLIPAACEVLTEIDRLRTKVYDLERRRDELIRMVRETAEGRGEHE